MPPRPTERQTSGDPQSARAIARAVAERAVSARELVTGALAAVSERDADLRAFTCVDAGLALAAAAVVDRRVAGGEHLPLAGVPFGVKELIAVTGLDQGYGTEALPRDTAAVDAECVRRLRAAGAIPLGVTRTSELAWRDDTPPTRNPLGSELSTGGSSGGSAAAVAAGLVPLALGTDTGGSIRLPAALCGCCGYKPTFGAVPLEGVHLISQSLDHVGPLGGSVDDLRLALAALTQAPPPASLPAAQGLRLGVPRDQDSAILDPDLARALEGLLQALAEAGVQLVPVDLPSLEAASAVVLTICLAEGAILLAGALTAPRGMLSDATRLELETAPPLASDIYLDACRLREGIESQMDQLFADRRLDAIVLPALRVAAPRRGTAPAGGGLSAMLRLADVTRQPACVVPLRRRPSPLAVQLLGARGDDAGLLAVAALVESLAGED